MTEKKDWRDDLIASIPAITYREQAKAWRMAATLYRPRKRRDGKVGAWAKRLHEIADFLEGQADVAERLAAMEGKR